MHSKRTQESFINAFVIDLSTIESWQNPFGLLDESDTDAAALLRYYEIDEAAVRRELSRAMEKFQRGNTRTPALSPHLLDLLEEAWVMASLDYGLAAVRSGTLLVALLRRDNLRSLMIESAPCPRRDSGTSPRFSRRRISKSDSWPTCSRTSASNG